MFTGIIQKIGKISVIDRLGDSPRDASSSPSSSGIRLWIETGYSDLELGESVAVNGVCLTVAEIDFKNEPGHALFFLSQETLDRTHLGTLQVGSRVNLERALQAGERLSGHIVQGHVDGKGQISRIIYQGSQGSQGESHLLEITLPPELSRYCVEKGSIAINGVSLTINAILPSHQISITLIPHTWLHTCFSDSQIHDSVNIEVDVFAKYVEKLCQPYQKQ